MTSDKPITIEDFKAAVLKRKSMTLLTQKDCDILEALMVNAIQQTEALRKENEALKQQANSKLTTAEGQTLACYQELKSQADKLAEALELIKDTAKCTDDRFASMSDYIYHLCESSLNEYKTL